MKYRITEPTFWMGQDRKPGDILTGETGPYRPFRSENGKMDRVAQFVEIGDGSQAQNLNHVTPLPPLTLHENHFMSITGIQSGAFQAQLEAMRKKLADRLTKGLTKIDGAAEAGAAKMDAAVDNVVAKVDKEIEDKLQEFASMTNGGPA
jgi:hypothetical protein